MEDSFRDSLASDADNYDVWCERCQKVHRHFTFTREDLDRVVSDGAKQLAEAIDKRAMEEVYRELYGKAH